MSRYVVGVERATILGASLVRWSCTCGGFGRWRAWSSEAEERSRVLADGHASAVCGASLEARR